MNGWVLHQAFFGAIAAAGFGVLFNFGLKSLPACAVAGALALGIRTIGLNYGWSLEAATFAAAMAASCCVRIAQGRVPTVVGMTALVGCIPMVPGAFFSQAILGFFAFTAPSPSQPDLLITTSLSHLLRVTFTVGGIGAGLALPARLLPRKGG